MVLALCVGTLAGCGLLPKGSVTAGGPTTAPATIGSPAVGTFSLDPFIPMTATTFSDGMAGIGEENSRTTSATVPATLQPVAGGKGLWNVQLVGSTFRFPTGAAELGSTRVVVGTNPSNIIPGRDDVPWVGVSDSGGLYAVSELGQSLFGGRSANFRGIGSTGNTLDPGSVFMVVGGVERTRGILEGNPAATDPIAVVSPDGKTWTRTSPLPLPPGVVAAEAWAITYAPSGTAHPGTIVTGVGWADVGPDNILGRRLGIVWSTSDAGKSWKIVSDDNFSHTGRDFAPSLAAADDSNIVVAGWADAQGQIGKAGTKQKESIEWYMGADGVWHIISDGKSLRSTRSSLTTALIARKAGGFISASEIYDRQTGPFSAGDKMTSDPVVRLFSSPDAATWTLIDDSVPGLDKAAIVNGIAEYADRDAFFGIDQTVHARAWVVDRATLK
jgi:hypothetical protein